MSRFKVALFTGNYNHIRDGVSLTLNRLVKYLMGQGVEVLVFGPTAEPPAMEHSGELVAVPSNKLPGRPEYRFSRSFPSDARKRLEDFDPDIVHIATPDLLGCKALRWAKRNDKSIVSSYHTHFASYLKYYKLSALEFLLWKYLGWFYSHCRHIYVPTPSMAEELKERGIESEMKIWARGIEHDLFNPDRRSDDWRAGLGFEEDDVVITFVSRLVWEKNLKLYAEMLNRLKQKYPNVKALVVGDGPASDGLRELLPEAVYTGFLKGEELATAYASSDIFFFPSDTETFGNVTLEAMASGLPCVVADAAGSKSLVKQENNGFLAGIDQKDRFFAYLERLVTKKSLRQEMAEVSVKMSRNYSWENINNNLLGYYKELLEQEARL
ncbi:MAG: glycosyltransferase family 1 protein [Balneolaceae bacterium]|nr:glycosyltransferase family 1 protein [Balneolaceae bacterium]MCH8547924.1 glycosyltransferase family 1 protein [Balneolaceae bacterium]